VEVLPSLAGARRRRCRSRGPSPCEAMVTGLCGCTSFS
jgi:uncharacterized OsmC-like protein